jgi:DNA polymerase-3 subunit alpha
MFMGMNEVDFEDIIAGVSLYRPGPMAHIPTYNARKNKYEEVSYPCSELEEIASNTFGLLVYQEQIMELTKRLGGYSAGEADGFRKAIGKKSQTVMDKVLPELNERILANGYSKEIAEWCIEAIKPFVGYGFNRSHAACYAFIAYQTAYLKANYPLEYMTALLTIFGDKEAKVVNYTKRARDMGIDVLQPDINLSQSGFEIDGLAIRFGLGSIKGLGDASIEAILRERETRSFDDLEDLLARIPKKELNKTGLRVLALSGALDSIATDHDNRFEIYKTLLVMRGDEPDEELADVLKNYTEKAKFEAERMYLGLYLTGHPLQRHADPVDWDELEFNESTITHVSIAEVRVIRTRKNDLMAFLKVDTLEGEKSMTVFPKAYETCKDELHVGMISKVQFSAKMNWQNDTVDYIVEKLVSPKKINKDLWKAIMKDQKVEDEGEKAV